MIKKKATYSLIYKFTLLKGFIAFAFFLLIMIKPVVNITTVFMGENHELIDTFDKENSEETEDFIELEDQVFFYLTASTIINFSKKNLPYKDIVKNSSNYCFEIQLPPPEGNC